MCSPCPQLHAVIACACPACSARARVTAPHRTACLHLSRVTQDWIQDTTAGALQHQEAVLGRCMAVTVLACSKDDREKEEGDTELLLR
jgi:hypothetical protein